MEKGIPMIYGKISEVMSKVWAIRKDRKNDKQEYNFRGIDDMYNALNVHLAEAKIFFAPEVLTIEREERTTKAGWFLTYTILTMRFTAYAEDGSSVSTTTVGEAMDSGDKSANKAMSTAYKYALMQIFCIPTEEEKDTEYQTHEIVPKDGKSEYVQNDSGEEKPWMNDPEFELLSDNMEKWPDAKTAIKTARKKYAVSKAMAKKIEDLYSDHWDPNGWNIYLDTKDI